LSRVGYDHALGYLNGGFAAWEKAGKQYETTKRITVTEFEKQYKTDKPLIIDIRKKSEFDSEHVVGAINIPLNQINNNLASFPKDKPFVLYCASSYRTMIASSILKQRGWDNFADVIGGFKEIAKTNIPRTEYVCPTTLL
jgi:rhodanese-related sulfurtransferase